VEQVGTDDTSITVTADHSHVFTIGGYGKRGNPIMGIVDSVEGGIEKTLYYKNTYTSLHYANGPGFFDKDVTRKEDLKDTTGDDYKQESAVPLKSETHGGEGILLKSFIYLNSISFSSSI
jgi:alkaline phosphatase